MAKQTQPSELQQQQNDLQQQQSLLDFRMKRHPELQPFVPSDRDKCPLNHSNRRKPNHLVTDPVNKQPKQFVSMNRLDQLAQPKRVFTRAVPRLPNTNHQHPTSSLTSSHTASTTASSSLTSNKNYNPPKSKLTPAVSLTKSSSQQQPKKVAQQQVKAAELSPPAQPILTQAIKQEREEVVPQVSVKIETDKHYQSALSEMEMLNSTTVNGDDNNGLNNFILSTRENVGSLYDELTAELSADGFKRPQKDTSNDTLSIREVEESGPQGLSFIQLTPTPIEQLQKFDDSTNSSVQKSFVSFKNNTDDERRIKAEEELKEVARREEEERQSRQSIVDGILSKINISSSQT